jgi:hypothetical protein
MRQKIVSLNFQIYLRIAFDRPNRLAVYQHDEAGGSQAFAIIASLFPRERKL